MKTKVLEKSRIDAILQKVKPEPAAPRAPGDQDAAEFAP